MDKPLQLLLPVATFPPYKQNVELKLWEASKEEGLYPLTVRGRAQGTVSNHGEWGLYCIHRR